MPWSASDAQRHNGRADTPEKRALWAKVANEELREHGNEGRAIRAANAAVDRVHHAPAAHALRGG
jgi:hypothetical protein